MGPLNESERREGMNDSTKKWLGNPFRVFLYITVPAILTALAANFDLWNATPTQRLIVIILTAISASTIYNKSERETK